MCTRHLTAMTPDDWIHWLSCLFSCQPRKNRGNRSRFGEGLHTLEVFFFGIFLSWPNREVQFEMPGRCVLLHGLSQLRPGEVRTSGLGGTAIRRMNGGVNRQLFTGCGNGRLY